MSTEAITRETPLVQMTAGQLADFLKAQAPLKPALPPLHLKTPGRAAAMFTACAELCSYSMFQI